MRRDRPHDDSITIPDRLHGATVLVTGGAGFVGSHLASALAEACEVRVVDDLSAGERERVPDGVTFVEGDVRETGALVPAADGVDYVFHQAGLSSVPESVRRPVESHGRNVDGTLAVLEVARENDARVVFASSAAVYGRPSTVPITEDEPADPTSPYGVDKLSADQYTRLYHERYGVETVALRYFNVYGPGQSAGVVGSFVDRARSDDPLTVEGDGDQTRDFVHVDDVVRANLAAATTDAVGRAYNVGTGESTRIDDLAATIRELADADVAVRHAEGRPADIQHSCADISRARGRLGFSPMVTLEDGLADMLAVSAARQ
ncbi:NAD-dependent epimerase/dehydratase family protein (plasmid) [Halolamina sp. CBA1230]|uniref:NAD-dependent epimerase/dehydratase family protein n=1 Tax=Halolamina sp. CBA1230 TaxID=1853690 RepID=UPI0009A1DD8F|nr:NAD-dependent epimerase/dehydratase family protein [Halolamina sp. CBA1230]QKY21977.1 NAD-dependent epimerase/dehydratase family protein [Halolamina sp. CBA1230]